MIVEDKDFIGKSWPQKCGDSLFVIEKIRKDNKTLFKCEFKKYSFIVYRFKSEVVKGSVLNPLIEENEFIGQIFPQHCGDDLKVLKKSSEKESNGNYFYECEFIQYPCKILARKSSFTKGLTLNPKIEEQEFVGKEFPQNCGDTLKVIRKTDKKEDGYFLYYCIFKKYPCEILVKKSRIIAKDIDNPNLPWKQKNILIEYINKNFKYKPSLIELANSLNVSRTRIGALINEFEIRDYIDYTYSGLENNIKDYISNFIVFDKKPLSLKDKNNNYKEIDIYIPLYNLGIEINGNYWHSNVKKLGVSNNYHQEKSLLAQENNISLMHIFEYEWNDLRQQEILKSLIKSKLGIFEKKIYARKCEIRELSYQEYAFFCNENHLQGEAGAKVKLGLFYQNKLVQIMSFSLPRFTDKYEWEIIRECSKLGYKIIGGKEKLWSYFIKKYYPNNCISYCDFSKFSGNSYLKLGFKKISLNKPGFVWYDEKTQKIFWRNPYKHKEMKEAGYLKIYDAGQLVFTWNKK